jgi:hypothetical protein
MASLRREDIERLERIDTNVQSLLKQDADKEKRIRALERSQWWHRGVLGVLAAFLLKIGLPIPTGH